MYYTFEKYFYNRISRCDINNNVNVLIYYHQIPYLYHNPCSYAKKILPLQTTNKNAETTISIVGRARARIALDSYW